MGSSPTSDNTEDLSQYDPGCLTGCKNPTVTRLEIAINFIFHNKLKGNLPRVMQISTMHN